MTHQRASRMLQRTRVGGGTSHAETDAVAVEEPLEIRVAGTALAVLLRTPGQDEELAVGFALTEGVLRSPSDVDEVRPCAVAPAHAADNIVDVIVVAGATPDLRRHTRPRYSNSACGVCGVAALENVMLDAPPLDDAVTVDESLLRQTPALLRAQQPAFDATGGLHAAMVFNRDGAVALVREDVGRHNATDKVLGAWALAFGDVPPLMLVVSSRAGFEIVQKAHMRRVPVVVSVGAPTTLAVACAQKAGITLAAFTHGQGFSLYAHPHRVRVA